MLKVSIMEEMLRLLKLKPLHDIRVDELCANINTTKVTFFNYFQYKEQVLDYFVRKWLYDRSHEIHSGKYRGEDGLYAVFRSICEDGAFGKKLMVSLVHYYSKLTERPPEIEISPCEYFLFNEEAFRRQVEPLDLKQVFVYYLSGISSIAPSRYKEMASQLVALLYGVPVQTHVMELDDMYPFYEAGVRSIVRS